MFRTLGYCDYFFIRLHGFPTTGVYTRQWLPTLGTFVPFTLIHNLLFRVQFSLGSHGFSFVVEGLSLP